jgi:hypothetical protein
MEDLQKEFVPYELALRMKQLGFDEPCLGFYNKEDRPNLGYCTNSFQDDTTLEIKCTAPLYQQAFRWFREKYQLQSEIFWITDMNCFWYKTGKFKYSSRDLSKNDYKTYEEAELACLEKLIEIVEIKE